VAHKPKKRNSLNGQLASGPRVVRPRILFPIGDAECFYTDNHIWRLAKRLQDQSEWEVTCVTTDEAMRKMAADKGVQSAVLPLTPRQAKWDEQLVTVNELISTTSDIVIPGTALPFCKPIALDEFRGAMLLFGAQPDLGLNVDLVIVPLMCVDNNSLNASGVYTYITAQARAQGIPVLGLEVSPLGNRNTMCQLPADHYAVKSHWSKNFLIKEGIAQPAQISILSEEECSLLRPGIDSYVEAYFDKETLVRQVLGLKEDDRFIVLVPHHFAFIWEIRQILRMLAQLPEGPTVVVQANPQAIRRRFTEPEMIAKVYAPEIKCLRHFIINTQVGMGLMAQVADLIVAPSAGTTTEGAALRRKPVIICQLGSDEGSDGEFLYWQPDAAKVPDLIRRWRESGILGRLGLRNVVRQMLRQARRHAA
jgi:hypothetical protein